MLLGRDAWPVLPLLKARGRDVQYFMWSRLQNGDTATAKQWLKEVPPHAAVIDTGFSGTILKVIKEVDPTSSGYLLSGSFTDFPQILGWRAYSKVKSIERIPKLIGRSSTYTSEGNAISKQTARDDEDLARVSRGTKFEAHDRSDIEATNRSILKLTGLPKWDVWRYENYVGLTPKDRLFVTDKQAVQDHYDKVMQARQAEDIPTWKRSAQ